MRQIEFVFTGRSNVGKSSIIRCLTSQRVPVGRRPGVTRKPLHLHLDELCITDLPGFGFMSGIEKWRQEKVKDAIVHYIEEHAEHILLGFLILDARSFLDIKERCIKRGEVPIDLEMHEFLLDMEIDTRIIVNKMDKITHADALLNAIAEGFNMLPPWQQWNDMILPISAKKKNIKPLQHVIRQKLKDAKKEHLLKHFPVQKY